MYNYIEDSKIDSQTLFDITSRYHNSKVIYYTKNNIKYICLETYKKNIYKLNNKDVFTLITPKYEYRPDLLSYDFYGTTDFWWKIMEMNNIIDIFDFKSGLTIRLPERTF